MESAFILSQTIFYSVASLAIIAIGIFFAIMMYHLVKITKELEVITHDFHNLTDEARGRINDIVERLSELPLLSFLLKRKKLITKK
jgi:L-lactate permease